MHKVITPGVGVSFHPGTKEEADALQRLIDKRHAFVQKFCAERGWPADGSKLSIPQIMEIRNQEEWKNPK